MDKILKNVRMNERTNKRTKGASERTNERTRFMNEISSTIREIEDRPFFRHGNRLFRQFLEILKIVTTLFYEKQRNITIIKIIENLQKRQFPAYFRHFRPPAGKNVFSKIGLAHVLDIVNTHIRAVKRKK